MLKLDKQIGGTIYWPFLATKRHMAWRGVILYWRGVVQYICLVGCKIQPIDGHVVVCLVLTVDVVYGNTKY